MTNMLVRHTGKRLLESRMRKRPGYATQRFAPPAVRAALVQRGVGLEAMQLGAACRTFNVLVQEERRVAAALFLR